MEQKAKKHIYRVEFAGGVYDGVAQEVSIVRASTIREALHIASKGLASWVRIKNIMEVK